MFDALPLRATDFVDIGLVWLLAWAGIAWLRTSPARNALAGLAILGAVYLIARQLELILATWILQAFFAVSVLIVVVVFQQDLRRLFEQIASIGRLGSRREAGEVGSIDILARSLTALVERRHGALFVVAGREPLDRHLEGGVELDGKVSEALFMSLFDPGSPGHDGAVLLERDRVARFALHLPLSSNYQQLGHRGTRHAAGLGLTERTDALCIIVSEERGAVTIASSGQLIELPPGRDVAMEIRGLLGARAPEASRRRPPFFSGVASRWREALLAVPLVAILWILVVSGSGEGEATREIPISIIGLPAGYAVESIDPPTGVVRLAGRRRDLLLLEDEELAIRVDAILVELGRRSFRISADDVRHPEGLEVLGVEPGTIKVSLRQTR